MSSNDGAGGLKRVNWVNPQGVTRRQVIKLSAASIAAIGLGGLGYGAALRQRVEISRVPVMIANLPDEFDGFTIGHMSDIHHGPYTSLEYIDRCVGILNGLKPDMIALTGDFPTARRRYVEPCIEVLKSLKAPAGVYAVIGNHDYYAGAGHVSRSLRKAGFNLLIDAKDRIEHRGSKLWMIGVDDYMYGTTDLNRLMRGTPPDEASIVLSHNPDFIEEFALKKKRFDLMLSGHTHGGQIRLPVIGAPQIWSEFGQRYAIGLNRKETMQVYTTRGIGAILLPARFDCPPEIVLYTLKKV